MTRWGLYGGAGFIGQHLAHSILSGNATDRVTLLDIRTLEEAGRKTPLREYEGGKRLFTVRADVRKEEQLLSEAEPFDVIVNLAAVHREPGHQPEEYFETNVSGAENICKVAEKVGCQEMIFTSTISVYGIHDRPVDERTVPEPKMPYGQSKVKAERIHRRWAEQSGGRLSIIRPGVVFGPGEDGNVTRLVGEMLKRQRPIQIRPDQPKAGIYIEELLDIIHWLRAQPAGDAGYQLVNGVSRETLMFNAYGRALEQLQKTHNRPLTVPATALKVAARLMTPFSRTFSSRSKFHPRRVTKLTLVNDVKPTELLAMGYPFRWTLEEALQHWMQQGL